MSNTAEHRLAIFYLPVILSVVAYTASARVAADYARAMATGR